MNNPLIIRLFIDEDFDSINNTVRWNGKARIKDESVAHHQYIASMFCRIILEDLFSKVDPELWAKSQAILLSILTKTMFHDFDEFVTGDILHQVKYNSFNGYTIREALEAFINHKMDTLFDKSIPCESMMLDAMEAEGIDKKLVKLFDWLALLFYVSKEISLGNKRFKNEWDYPVSNMKDVCNEILAYDGPAQEVWGIELDFSIIQFILEYDFNQILTYYE